MKTVNTELENYMLHEKNFETCDLYKLALLDGREFYYSNYDVDVIWNNHTWYHNKGLFTRNQTRQSGKVAVDTMDVTIICDTDDKFGDTPVMKACHDGVIDNATLSVYKVYFSDGVTIGGFEIFEGVCEVASAGGLKIKITVKSLTQGLARLLPVRIFTPQASYTNVNGTITTSSTDNCSMVIPLKPSGKVLIDL